MFSKGQMRRSDQNFHTKKCFRVKMCFHNLPALLSSKPLEFLLYHYYFTRYYKICFSFFLTVHVYFITDFYENFKIECT